MKTKLFSFFLALAASVGMALASDIEVDGIWYDFSSSTMTATVTFRGSDYSSYSDRYTGDVTIPETVTYNAKTYSVTSIGGSAFYNCSGLTSVTIPNSVTSIGRSAFFYCRSLTSVTISNSVTSIEQSAFGGCSSLTDVTIPNSVTIIESGAFSGCSSLTDVTIPNSVTIIGSGAFSGCSSLTSVTIPNSVTSIANHAFLNCTGLTSATIPNSVTRIGDEAFGGCTSLTSITCQAASAPELGAYVFNIVDKSIPLYVPSGSIEAYRAADGWKEFTNIQAIPCLLASGSCGDNLTWELSCDSVLTISGTGEMGEWESIEDVPWVSDTSKIKRVIIADGVTSIGDDAFRDCHNLKSIAIPNSVTTIGYRAFYWCTSLTEINLPNSVTSIGNYAFVSCTSLSSITLSNDLLAISGGAFSHCTALTSIEIPNSVTSINELAFEYCSSLESVTIPNSVKNIGFMAFWYCDALTSVEIPNTITNIGLSPFAACANLTTITIASDNNSYCSEDGVLFNKEKTELIQYPGSKEGDYMIPQSVTQVNAQAFYGCHSLESVDIPKSVTNIGYAAFYKCSSLNSLICEAITPPICAEDAFLYVDKSIPLYVPTESVEAYRAADGWKEFTNIQPICPIASGTCGAEGDNLTWELSCDSVLTISGTGAMADFDGNNQPWYEERENIKSIIIEEGVTSIGGSAFDGCSSMISMTIPNSVTSIESLAFSSCISLTSISVAAENTIYDSRENCNAIIETASNMLIVGCQNTVIPNSVTNIGENAFGACRSLTTIEIPNSVTSIGAWAFSDCSGLTYVNIPKSITSIGHDAFFNCTSLTSLIIPNNVASIGYWAFYGCSGLTFITCEASTPPTLGNSVFYGVDKSIPLYVPAESVDTYKTADRWNVFTNILAIDSEELDPNHPQNPGNYQLTLNVSNEFAGMVTGAGLYPQGTEVDITATANTGYTFTQWSDGVTDASRSITLAKDSTLTAVFTINRYTITFVDEDGTTVLASNEYNYGTTPVVPADPTKAATAQYTYTFAGWSPSVDTVTGDATYTATYSQTVNKYTVTFVEEDGTTFLASDEYDYGATPVAPADPTKAATAQYTYTFAGWSPSIAAVTGDATYTATYSQTVNKYTVTFVDEDGTTVLASDEYDYGATPVAPANPTKAATAQYTYTFAGWSPSVATVIGDATYTATYSQTVNKYTITFVDEDGTTVLSSDEYEYGATPVAPADPTKAATAQYTYTFTGWSPAIANVTGTATYTATYSQTVNKYTITFMDEDGTTVLASDEYDYGTTPVAPADPSKTATAQYTYTFTGWSPEVVAVTGAATYTATYSLTTNKYIVTFVDEDGTTVLASDEYDYGTTPVAPADPSKTATAQYTYTFTGWSPEVVAVTGAATYTATYSQTTNKYIVTFVDEDGTTVLSSDEYEYGATPVAPADPTKAATEEYTYTFSGWDKTIAIVTEAATYTATYSSQLNNVAVTGDQDLADLPVGENTHITVGEDGNLTVSEPTTIGTITVTVNGDEASEITGVENLTVTNAEMILRLEPNKANATPNKWYAFGVPFEVEVSGGIYAQGSASPAIYNSAFVLDEYDGSLRASTQQGWKRVSSSAILQPGVLYMISIGSTTNEWRFVKRASASLAEQTSLSVAAYPSAIGAHHAGWNGLANTLFRDASVALDGVQYITTYNNEQSVYEVQPISDATLAMAKPFFVQVPQAGTLYLAAQPAGVAARSLMAADEQSPSCVLSLSSADFTDRAYITAQVGKENTYSIGHDLMKMLNGTPSVPQLWLEGYNMHLAAYELALASESTTFIIPLGLYAPQNGTYTLDAETPSDYYTLTLLADDTPVAELGEQTVSIELEQGNNSKYALRITKKADVVTDIVNGTADGIQVVKFVQDDLLYILRDGKTYTIQGVEVK